MAQHEWANPSCKLELTPDAGFFPRLGRYRRNLTFAFLSPPSALPARNGAICQARVSDWQSRAERLGFTISLFQPISARFPTCTFACTFAQSHLISYSFLLGTSQISQQAQALAGGRDWGTHFAIAPVWNVLSTSVSVHSIWKPGRGKKEQGNYQVWSSQQKKKKHLDTHPYPFWLGSSANWSALMHGN